MITDDELINAGKGCETLYYPNSQQGAYIANAVQHALAPTLFKDRGIKEGWYRMNPKNGSDFFLDKTRCTAIILEPDFIHRKDEIQRQRKYACESIARTLLELQDEL